MARTPIPSLTRRYFSVQLDMMKAFLSVVLHSHLPWVLGHGRWPHGTDWLNEAAAECYIPLLNELTRLIQNGHRPYINIGITPVLQEQLTATSFVEEFKNYLQQKITAAQEDMEEFKKKGDHEFLTIAKMWHDYYQHIARDFSDVYKGNLVAAFSRLQDEGFLEIMTSGATHGYLPLLKYDRSVNAQVRLGVEVYKKHFRRQPHGMWLPECAYRPAYAWTPPTDTDAVPCMRKGVDEFLSTHGIQFFITDAHLLKGGRAIGVYLSRFRALKNLWRHFEKEFIPVKEEFLKSQYEVYLVSSNPKVKPVAVFTRDPVTASQVWSGDLGYPGESVYLDFHKKRFPGGHRYWRVTNPKIDLAEKELYDPKHVDIKLHEHARHFVSLIKEIAVKHHDETGQPVFVCVPFDTELFGHWWFEGPRWLASVLSLIDRDDELSLATGSTILDTLEPHKVISLSEGSWGEGGFHYIWLNQWTEWTWKHIYDAEDDFYALYDEFARRGHMKKQSIMKQLARELLLLQSSDWQFLISTWSARDYAELRFSRHYENFRRLAEIMRKPSVSDNDRMFIKDLEEQDSCFSDLDLSIFSE
jgi:1,4-alpha-glucan branching enzyme